MPEGRYFEQPELWGDSAESGPHAQRIRETVDMIPSGITSLLDLGAGDGALVHALRVLRPEVRATCLERSRAAIAHVQAPKVVGSVDHVPAPDRSVDCVTICEVIEHLPEPTYSDTLAEIGRVARTHVLITVPNAEDRRRGQVTCAACGCRFNRFQHLRSFRSGSMRSLVPGFEFVEAREIGPLGAWYPWWLAAAAERSGVIRRAGAPICPQCGAGEPPPNEEPPLAEGGLKRLLPRSRSRVWLGAVYRRAPSPGG